MGITNGHDSYLGVSVGEKRAEEAAKLALESPLLNETKIVGAKHLLVNYTYGNEEPYGREIKVVNQYFQQEAGSNAQLKFGLCHDPNMGPELSVTIIATGFSSDEYNPVMAIEEEVEEPLGFEIDFGDEEEEKNDAPQVEESRQEQGTLFERKERKWRDRGEALSQEHQGEKDRYNTPAYLRKGVELDEGPNEMEISKLSLTEDTDVSKDISLRPGNSYLHDNVD